MNNKKITADLMIFLSAVLWGGEYVVVKDMVSYLPPNWINSIRFLAAGVVMVPFIWKKIKHISKLDIKGGIVIGIFMFGGFCLQTIGIQYTTAGKSGFLTSTYVIMVPFVVWLLKRIFPGFKSFICAGILVSGIALLAFDSGAESVNSGDLITLCAAFVFSFQIISFDYYAKKCDAVNLTFIELMTSGLLGLFTALSTEPLPSFSGFGTSEILQFLYLIMLGTLLCNLLSTVAMKWAEPSHAAIIWSLESVFALFFGVIFLNEALTVKMSYGFLLVFIAVFFTEFDPLTIIRSFKPKKLRNTKSL